MIKRKDCALKFRIIKNLNLYLIAEVFACEYKNKFYHSNQIYKFYIYFHQVTKNIILYTYTVNITGFTKTN